MRGTSVKSTEYIGMEGDVSALSAGAYAATLPVMVNIVKGGGHVTPPPPPPSATFACFSIMMECPTESGRCHSVYSVVKSLYKFKASSGITLLVSSILRILSNELGSKMLSFPFFLLFLPFSKPNVHYT